MGTNTAPETPLQSNNYPPDFLTIRLLVFITLISLFRPLSPSFYVLLPQRLRVISKAVFSGLLLLIKTWGPCSSSWRPTRTLGAPRQCYSIQNATLSFHFLLPPLRYEWKARKKNHSPKFPRIDNHWKTMLCAVVDFSPCGLFKQCVVFFNVRPAWLRARGGWKAEAWRQRYGDCANLKDPVTHAVQCANYGCLSSICFHLGSIRKVSQ